MIYLLLIEFLFGQHTVQMPPPPHVLCFHQRGCQFLNMHTVVLISSLVRFRCIKRHFVFCFFPLFCFWQSTSPIFTSPAKWTVKISVKWCLFKKKHYLCKSRRNDNHHQCWDEHHHSYQRLRCCLARASHERRSGLLPIWN